MKRKLLMLWVCLACIMQAWAYDFEVDGIYYDKNGDNATVTYVHFLARSYSGDIIIPATVTYSGKTYGVTSIGGSAFYYCNDLTSITIPNSVIKIGYSAFQGCSSLTSITIPNSVTSIGSSAFENTAWYNNQPDGLVYIGNVLYKYKGTMPDNSNITIKEGTVSISEYAFSECSSLTSITIPNSVTSIGSRAFQGCSSLTSITIPNSVISIEGSAFRDCSSLTSITIPNSVISIGSSAFQGCSSLTSITIPNSVTSIGGSAFENCTSLTSITIPNSVTSIESSAFENTAWYNNQPIGLVYIGNVLYKYKGTMPDNSNITIKEGTISISEYAFSECSSLTSITIPNSVTSIGSCAFLYCSSLTSITIPNSVTSIGSGAFVGCESLASVSIGSGIINIGNDECPFDCIFSSCSNLLSIEVNENNRAYSSIDGILFNKEKTNLILCPEGKSGNIEISENVESIGGSAFSGCFNLKSITMKSSNPPKLEWNVFGDMKTNCTLILPKLSDQSTYLQSDSQWKGFKSYYFLNISGSVNDNITWNVTNKILYINGTGEIPNYTNASQIPWTVVSDSIQQVIIGSGITSVGNAAFSFCKNLTAANIPESVTRIGEFVFGECKSLTSIILPSGITRIYAETFSGCTSLKSVVIPNSVSKIDHCAFKDCKSLKAITLPPGLTSIEEGTFTNCTSLNSIVIPSSMENIHNTAFSGCTNIEELTIPFTYSNWNPLTSKLKKLTITTKLPTSLGACTNLTELTIPVLTSNLKGLFGGAIPQSLEKLTITQPAKYLPANVLSGCSTIKVLDIAGSIQELGENALYGCSGLTDIYSRWAYPPVTYGNTFSGVNKFACTIHVPEGSKQFYEKADGWKEFFNIQEEAPLAITALAVPLYGGVVNGLREYQHSEEAKLEAIANLGYEFKGWMENENIINTVREYTFTATNSRTLYAVFTPKENADKTIVITPQPTTASIVWNVVNDAKMYTLVIYSDEAKTQELSRIDLDVNGNVILRSNQAVLSHTIKNLSSDTPYYYSLTSYNEKEQILTISTGNFTTLLGGTAIEEVEKNEKAINTYISDNTLYIDTPTAEIVSVYSITGELLHRFNKPAGEFNTQLNALDKQMIIIQGSSGWIKKQMN